MQMNVRSDGTTYGSVKKKLHASNRPAYDMEVGVYYTATQWALTFPNLRRHQNIAYKQ